MNKKYPVVNLRGPLTFAQILERIQYRQRVREYSPDMARLMADLYAFAVYCKHCAQAGDVEALLYSSTSFDEFRKLVNLLDARLGVEWVESDRREKGLSK